jgi:hypothetical protein
MPILLARREDTQNPRSHFIVRIKGEGDTSEKAPCVDEAIGAPIRKNPSKFCRLTHEIEIKSTEDGYFAYVQNLPTDVYGLGYCPDSAIGAIIRLNPKSFNTTIVLRGETNGPRKPR